MWKIACVRVFIFPFPKRDMYRDPLNLQATATQTLYFWFQNLDRSVALKSQEKMNCWFPRGAVCVYFLTVVTWFCIPRHPVDLHSGRVVFAPLCPVPAIFTSNQSMDRLHRPKSKDQLREAMCEAMHDFKTKIETKNSSFKCKLQLFHHGGEDDGYYRARLVWRRKQGADRKLKKVTFSVQNDFDLEAFQLMLQYELSWAGQFSPGSDSDSGSNWKLHFYLRPMQIMRYIPFHDNQLNFVCTTLSQRRQELSLLFGVVIRIIERQNCKFPTELPTLSFRVRVCACYLRAISSSSPYRMHWNIRPRSPSTSLLTPPPSKRQISIFYPCFIAVLTNVAGILTNRWLASACLGMHRKRVYLL